MKVTDLNFYHANIERAVEIIRTLNHMTNFDSIVDVKWRQIAQHPIGLSIGVRPEDLNEIITFYKYSFVAEPAPRHMYVEFNYDNLQASFYTNYRTSEIGNIPFVDQIEEVSLSILKRAIERLKWSMVTIRSCLIISMVIAGLDNSPNIKAHHIAEAVNYFIYHYHLEDEPKPL